MKEFSLMSEQEVRLMRDLIDRENTRCKVGDFEEYIQLQSIRKQVRLWKDEGTLIAFSLIDPYFNLRFTIFNEMRTMLLEDKIVKWGKECVWNHNNLFGKNRTLDASFEKSDVQNLRMLKRHGFVQEDIRTLRYSRSMDIPIEYISLPDGFIVRPVKSEDEVSELVSLHRAAFKSDQMTIEERLAIMRTLNYIRDLDLVVTAPDDKLIAFCICGIEDTSKNVGYTDPIGTHPDWQQRGMANAVIRDGLRRLKSRGVKKVELGTSSKNIPMQKLAGKSGFTVESELLWFSKVLG